MPENREVPHMKRSSVYPKFHGLSIAILKIPVKNQIDDRRVIDKVWAECPEAEGIKNKLKNRVKSA